MRNNVERYTFIANFQLACAYFAYVGVLFVWVIACFFLDRTAGFLMLVLWLSLVVTALCITDRWCVLISVDQEGLYYRPLFRKGIFIKYKQLPRIQYAYYKHGNRFFSCKIHFFVLTNRRLDEWELYHINEVSPGRDLIKIRYSKGSYEKLISVLPAGVSEKVKGIYSAFIAR